MKYSIIEDIYYGERGRGDSVKLSEEAQRLGKEWLKLYEDLSKTLTGEQKEKLDNLLNKNMDSEAEATFCYYKEGLKVGLLLFAECLVD